MKSRFKNQNFKQQLKSARGYTRESAGTKQGPLVRLLRMRVFWYGLLAFAFFITFILTPSPLYVHSVAIVGAGPVLTAKSDLVVQQYLNRKVVFMIPAGLYARFDTESFIEEVKKELPEALEVSLQKQGWFSDPVLAVVKRTAQFRLLSDTVEEVVDWNGQKFDPASDLDKRLPKVEETELQIALPPNSDSQYRQSFLYSEELEAARKLKSQLPKFVSGLRVVRVELLPVTTLDQGEEDSSIKETAKAIEPKVLSAAGDAKSDKKYLEVPSEFMRADFQISSGQQTVKVLLGLNFDPEDISQRFDALLSSYGIAKLAAFSYVDLRFPGKAFLCETGKVCSGASINPSP